MSADDTLMIFLPFNIAFTALLSTLIGAIL